MVGWSSSAAAWASAMKAIVVGLGGELPREDHLHGHNAVERDLPGLVDHAHAAAGDLFQKFVVAKVADFASKG